jgi:outer membrane protein OmpA-like peptidoglycan-associated protein
LIERFSRHLAGVGFAAMLGFVGCATESNGLTAAQVAVLQQQGFDLVGGEWELGLSDKVLFATNSDVINPATDLKIGQLGRALISVDIEHLRVEGHTDNYGTDAYNDGLSFRRAGVVAAALERAGLLSSNIQVLGLGKQDPVADNNTPGGRAENRRVSIIVDADQ